MAAHQRSDAGEVVHAARTNRNWSQQRLADAIGCSQAVISRLETGGQVSFAILERLAIALEIEPNELIADAAPKPVDTVDPHNELRNALKHVANMIFQRAYAERMSEVIVELGSTSPLPVMRGYEGLTELVEAISQMPKSDDPL